MKPGASGFLVAPRPVPIRDRPIAGYETVQLPVVGASDCRFRLRLIATLPPGYLKPTPG